MRIIDSLPETQAELLSELGSLDRPTLKRLYRDLPVPDLKNLAGEFDAQLLDQGGPWSRRFTEFMLNRHGTWVGKALIPESDCHGQGYTCFRKDEQLFSDLPTKIRIGDSPTGGGQALLIEYSETCSGIARWMTDELRQYGPGVMLGIGIWRPVGIKKFQRRMMFALVGPTRAIQHCVRRRAA